MLLLLAVPLLKFSCVLASPSPIFPELLQVEPMLERTDQLENLASGRSRDMPEQAEICVDGAVWE